MTDIPPGWYKDPADPAVQRYWDGEGWIGEPLPADAEPPPGPPVPSAEPPSPQSPSSPDPAAAGSPVAVSPAPTGPTAGDQHLPPPGPGTGPPPPGGPMALPYRPGAGPVPVPRPHGLVLATLGSRLVARLIDIFVLALLNLVVNGWFIWQLAVEMGPLVEQILRYADQETSELPQESARAGYLRIVIVVITAALWLAYEVPAVANNGQTLGKRLLGIRVVRMEDPGPVGFARSLRRWNTIGLPTLLWPCCGIGFVLQFVDAVYLLADRPLQQALHDKSARTVVVRVDSVGPRPPGAGPSGPVDGPTEKTPGGPA